LQAVAGSCRRYAECDAPEMHQPDWKQNRERESVCVCERNKAKVGEIKVRDDIVSFLALPEPVPPSPLFSDSRFCPPFIFVFLLMSSFFFCFYHFVL
jgi:hypothetical protein